MAKSRHAAARGSDVVTPGQRAEFENLIKRGQVTREGFQEFLRHQGDPWPMTRPFTRPEKAKFASYWKDAMDKALNGQGVETVDFTLQADAMAELVRPLHLMTELVLQPATPDLEEQLREAMFWTIKPIQGMKVITPQEFLDTEDTLFNDGVDRYQVEMAEIVPGPNARLSTGEIFTSIVTDKASLLTDVGGADLLGYVSDFHEHMDQCLKLASISSTEWPNESWRSWIDAAIHVEFLFILSEMASCAAIGRMSLARLYLPYLEIFFSGRFPFLLTSQGVLYVLCGDPE